MSLQDIIPALFDLDSVSQIVVDDDGPRVVPSIILADDSARTRRTDPHTSHVAGDNSQRNLHESKQRVLHLVNMHAPITGRELNETYRRAVLSRGWKRVAFDTPRKRAGELARDGFLEVVGTQIAEGNNSPEAAYGLTERGRNMLGVTNG